MEIMWGVVKDKMYVAYCCCSAICQGLLWWFSNKESTCNAGNLGLIPGSGKSPGAGHGNPLQYSCLENPMNRGAQRATVHTVKKSWTQLKRFNVHTHKTHRTDILHIFPFLKPLHQIHHKSYKFSLFILALTQTLTCIQFHFITDLACLSFYNPFSILLPQVSF